MKKNSNECIYKNVCFGFGSICAGCKHKHDNVINDDLYKALKVEYNREKEEVDEDLKNAIIKAKRER